MSFNRGDKVIVNDGLIAEILVYDEEANIVTYVHSPAGGGTDTVTAHVSNTKIVPFGQPAPAELPLAALDAAEAPPEE